MRRTFQKWLLIFVSIAFLVTFVTFFLVLWNGAVGDVKTNVQTTLETTQNSIETNFYNLEQTLEESKKDTANKAQSASLILLSEAQSEAEGTASFMMDRHQAIDFNSLYSEAFPIDPEIVTYDENGEVPNPLEGYSPSDLFSDSSSRSASQKYQLFDQYFTLYVKPIMEKIYPIATGVKATSLHLIDPGQVINPATDINNPEAGGYILGSTTIGYFGYDMYNRNLDSSNPNYNQQSVDFMNYIYASQEQTYAQDILTDSSGQSWQYAGIKLNDSNIGVIQVGTNPEDILERMERLSFENLIKPITISNAGKIIYAELEDYEIDGKVYKKHVIKGITNEENTSSSWIGKPLEEYGVSEEYLSSSWNEDHFSNFNCGGHESFVSFVRGSNTLTADPSDDYVLVASVPFIDAFASEITSLISLTVGTLFLFIVIFILISLLVQRIVINGIYQVNGSLKQITNGNLDVEVNVKHNKEFRDLSDGINTTVSALKRFIEEEKNRNAQDLALAKSIQSSSLPTLFPPYPERDEFNIFAKMDTAKEVGGDFYDFFFIDGQRFIFLIADVSGKGIPAALFMMRAKTLIKSLAETRTKSPAQIFYETNNSLCENNDSEMFVTAFMAMVDVSSGELTYVNAGHNPPIVILNNEANYLKIRPSFVLGGIKNFKYKEEHLKLNPGDSVYLYTDGVSEATNEKEELYGEDRLLKLFKNVISPIDDTKMIETISKDIDDFVAGYEQSDDITQVCFTYLAKSSNLKDMHKLFLPTNDETLDTLTALISKELEDCGADKKDIYNITLVLEEVFANIKNYAYGGKVGHFIFAYQIKDEQFSMEFIDYGVEFNPLTKNDPNITLEAKDRPIGGLGIFLVKSLMDDVSYQYYDLANHLKMRKRLKIKKSEN